MILSGKEISAHIRQEIAGKVSTFSRKPGLAMILVGTHAPSQTYVEAKKRACEEVGMFSKIIRLEERVSEEELLKTIATLNRDSQIDGILLQSPLPSHLNMQHAISKIDPEKDVDGFHPLNMGKLLLGLNDGFVPCTPLGIVELLKRSQISLTGAHVVIVGRSQIVGKPLAALMLQHDSTVTIAHSKTKNLSTLTSQADILVAAMGKPKAITVEMVGQGSIVVDVGITRQDGRLVGDVDFENVKNKCKALTPVPGGVGPMTIAMLLQNTCTSFERRCAS